MGHRIISVSIILSFVVILGIVKDEHNFKKTEYSSDFKMSIRLNVGGVSKDVSRETLIKSPVFETVLSSVVDDSAVFVDRDSDLFDEVVLYLAWDVKPDTPNGLMELEHYGLSNDSADKAIQERADKCAEQILSGEPPYYVCASGILFATSKQRLSQLPYFAACIDGRFEQRYRGTIDDPYLTDIPANIFKNVLSHLRDSRVGLLPKSIAILSKLGFGQQGSISSIAIAATPNRVDDKINVSELQRRPDISFHGNPEITFWRSAEHRRCTNAVLNRVRVDFDGNDKLTLPRTCGHLIYKCYIRWEVLNHNGEYAQMDVVSEILLKNPTLLYEMIDNIVLRIGGQLIYRAEGYQMHMWEMMRGGAQKQRGLTPRDLCLSIPFSFCDYSGNALPIVALEHHDVDIELRKRKLQLPSNIEFVPHLLVTYVYLDDYERRQLCLTALEYLLNFFYSSQIVRAAPTCAGATNHFDCNLEGIIFNTAAIYFTLHEDDSPESLTHPIDDLVSFELQYKGEVRCDGDNLIAGKLARLDHNINPDAPVYVIPFSLNPLDTENPSLTQYIRNFPQKNLRITTSKRVKNVRVWGNYWNVLRINSGMAGLAYTAN
jgi:hypothetical protein